MLLEEGKVVYKDLSYLVCGILFQTHNDLGRYKNEKQYADYLEFLFTKQQVAYLREYRLEPSFPGEKAGRNICDFIVDNRIVIEIKAKKFLTREDYFQAKRYLSTSGLRLALLVNFRQKFLTPKRILNNELLHQQ